MEKKPRKQKRDYDFAVNAFRVVQEATGQIPEPEERKSPILVKVRTPQPLN